MPTEEEEAKRILCAADAAYYGARAIRESLDLMLISMKTGPGREAAAEYDAAIRPHVEAIIVAAQERDGG